MPRTGPVPSACSGGRQAPAARAIAPESTCGSKAPAPVPRTTGNRDRVTARTSRNDLNRVDIVPAKAAGPLSTRPAAPSLRRPAAVPGSPVPPQGVPPSARPRAVAPSLRADVPFASAPLPGRRAGTAALAPWPPRLRRRTPVPARHRRGHGPPGAGPSCRRSFPYLRWSFPYLRWWCGQAPALGLSGPSAGPYRSVRSVRRVRGGGIGGIGGSAGRGRPWHAGTSLRANPG